MNTRQIVAGVLLTVLVLPRAACALDSFPLESTVARLRPVLATNRIQPTGLTRQDYLNVVAGIVDYFRHFQNDDGRIIDPFLHKEFQYSTPCYAWAAAALIDSGRQADLLSSASRALDASLNELASGQAADHHEDFFTFPSVLAYEHLRNHVSRKQRKHWEDLLRSIDPDRVYRDRLTSTRHAVHNWNLVALSGEFLRHQDGFTGMNYVETNLALQLNQFTTDGLYEDPNLPMAYDHFPRHFLAAMSQRGYNGRYRAQLDDLLNRAAWTSLLMQSPCGELSTGGRSSEHQWNEAMQCVTYEIWAARNQRVGDVVAARAFKRAARLALQSVQNWVRPSGELWIIKNRFDPAVRHGFMGYSSHSQYNLLAASMLATAWLMADDTIPEGSSPADAGGFVFELPEFHKVFANAGGLYLELETAADPAYNSTGLIRVQRTGVNSLPCPSDTPAIETEPLAVGIAWRDGDHWQPLAAFGKDKIRHVALNVTEERPLHVRFSILYELQTSRVKSVREIYELSPERVRVTSEIQGDAAQLQVRFPAFVFDGKDTSEITIAGANAAIHFNGSIENFTVESPAGVELHRSGRWIPSRNGFVEEIYGDVTGKRVTYILQPERVSDPAPH